jgi:ectoine hydroxylase
MLLTSLQVEQFNDQGYLMVDTIFEPAEIQAMVEELPVLFAQDSPEVFRQRGSNAIRTVFAPEQFSELFDAVYRLNRLIEPVKQLLDDEAYLFQSKFNTKVSLAQGSWDWHQDFIFWKDDGMPAPKAITVAIYLQDVTEFSGGMVVIPRSHKLGMIDARMQNPDGMHDENLKYALTSRIIQEAAEKCGGLASTTGKKGTVLFFDSNILHASAQNLHYEDRNVIMLTYNGVKNRTKDIPNPRPSYMVKRDYTPIKSIKSLFVLETT